MAGDAYRLSVNGEEQPMVHVTQEVLDARPY